MLAPMAPHITEELWKDLGHEESVHVSNWPLWDEKLVTEEVITLAVQVNGKVRSEIVVETDISEADAIEAAKNDEKVAPHLEGKTIKKAIYVPGRLVSLVV
jgi:leucyl-tRNA synthetase